MTSDARTAVKPQHLAEDAIELVRQWLVESEGAPDEPAAARLSEILRDARGLEFAVGFIDGVIRTEDPRAAGKRLNQLVDTVPDSLPRTLRWAIRAGGALVGLFSGAVVSVARRALRRMVRHLVIDATDAKLGSAIARLRRSGVSLNINLLGESILGDREAKRRLEGTLRLLSRPDIDYVSIKVSSAVAPHNRWAFDETVRKIEQRLLPLFERAAAAEPSKFINLDMEEYKDFELTISVFTRILERPEFKRFEAGIVLQAYLPDALSAMMRLQNWAAARVDDGGAPIKVRVVKGANLPMERVEAELHGWPLSTWHSKQDTDTCYKAVLDYALHADRVKHVRIGVAGHNLFDIALAWLLANARDAQTSVTFEMLLGMATHHASAVRRTVGDLRLYVPVVHPDEFDVAISYLVRRLEEGASDENFMSTLQSIEADGELFEREKNRFLASLESVATFQVPKSNRDQDRAHSEAAGPGERVEARVAARTAGEFENCRDTDPDLPSNQAWARGVAARMTGSLLGDALVQESRVSSEQRLETIVSQGVEAAELWQSVGAEGRARILHRAAEQLEARRAQLLEVMGSECAKTLDQSDPEVSEVIDFANYYAALGQQLERVEGAAPVPQRLVVVLPPWNFPAAIAGGGTLAGLASGASVILKPSSRAPRTAALIVEALWQAGVPRNALQLVQFDDRELSARLIADPRVDRVVLTGSYETAVQLRELRENLPILAETSGKNAIIVTPSADFDLAARDVANSAFGHAGQKCSAASLVVLVGSAGTSTRFRNQLIDAVTSFEIGTPEHLATQLSPLIAAPTGKLLHGLTRLGAGETWLIEPEQVESSSPLASDSDGRSKLWSPGLRVGVKRGSEYHLTEYFGPILGIMTATSLDEAIDIVNDVDFGLTSGLHSLDHDEIELWTRRVQAGNLYVNRGITGAIVRRQPFGGWKKSAVGAGAKAGGPNYLHGLVDWVDAPVGNSVGNSLGNFLGDSADTPVDAFTETIADAATRAPRAVVTPLLAAARQVIASDDEFAWLHAACCTDADAWRNEFGVTHDPSALEVERNVLRYLPAEVTIRATADASLSRVIRTVAAAVAAGSKPLLDLAARLPEPLLAALAAAEIEVKFGDDAAWLTRVRHLAGRTGSAASARLRIVAGASRASAVAQVFVASRGKPDIAVYGGEVVSGGRVEMLPYLREQAVSITAHRFGSPDRLAKQTRLSWQDLQ